MGAKIFRAIEQQIITTRFSMASWVASNVAIKVLTNDWAYHGTCADGIPPCNGRDNI